jgi:hypothetical protein
MGIPFLASRAFNADDLNPGTFSVIIDPELALSLWPRTNPVGKRFRLGPTSEWRTVVGVAADVTLTARTTPTRNSAAQRATKPSVRQSGRRDLNPATP